MTTAVRTLSAAVREYREALAAEALADDTPEYVARQAARVAARGKGVDILAELETAGHAALARLLRLERATQRCLLDPGVTIVEDPRHRAQLHRDVADAIDAVQRYLEDADADGDTALG